MRFDDFIENVLAFIFGFGVIILVIAFVVGAVKSSRQDDREELKNEIISQIEENQETETEKHYCQWCGKVFELPKEDSKK